jgi:hypothetical protein
MGKIRLVASKKPRSSTTKLFIRKHTIKTEKQFHVSLQKNLSKKFELGRFELLSISKTRPCHICRTFTHTLELHVGNHGLAT